MKKGEIKDFLKPSLRKTLIFLLLLLVYLLPVYPCELEIHGINEKCIPGLKLCEGKKFVPIYMGIFSAILREDITSYQECGMSDEIWWTSCKCESVVSFLLSIIGTVVFYFLSCTLVRMYERGRK